MTMIFWEIQVISDKTWIFQCNPVKNVKVSIKNFRVSETEKSVNVKLNSLQSIVTTTQQIHSSYHFVTPLCVLKSITGVVILNYMIWFNPHESLHYQWKYILTLLITALKFMFVSDDDYFLLKHVVQKDDTNNHF
jgi:hypothetical protein